MIDYVEIRDPALVLIGLLDTCKSIIWETQYYGSGSFEVYTAATPQAVEFLKTGNYVTRPESENVGIIESVEITMDGSDGRMIAASGRFAKSILDRRLITYVNGHTNASTTFSGNVEARARGLVQDNAINCYKDKGRTIPYTARNIPILILGDSAGLQAVTESRQTSTDNLLIFTDEFLQMYGYGAKVIRKNGKLAYTVYSGTDRSIGNSDGNEPVIFSEDFDNLTGSQYSFSELESRTTAIVGGEGEGLERFFVECGADASGMDRREVFFDKQSIKREVYTETFYGDGVEIKDSDGNVTGRTGTRVFTLTGALTAVKSVKVKGSDAGFYYNQSTKQIILAEIPLDGEKIDVEYINDDEYAIQLAEAGNQDLQKLIPSEDFSGRIDIQNSTFRYGKDFDIGDIVTVQDNGINKYINVRVIACTEVQDDDGYAVEIDLEAV